MKKYFFIMCLLLLLNFTKLNAIENKIEFKVNNEIITTIDIIKELNFLASINPKILELDKEKIFEISKKSVIKEKIKKIEILKHRKEIKVEDKFLDNLLMDSYRKLNIKSRDEFFKHLTNYNLELEEFKTKITIEALWNQIIFSKFKSKINIDTKKIKNNVINDKKNKIKSFNLSEIIFNIEQNKFLEKKYKQIKDEINLNGFEKAAIIHSISSTANTGGKLGWINQRSINQKIYEKIKNLGVGEITKPIVVPSGFLIIKLNETKIEEKKINLEEEIKKQIVAKTNQQLNQFSNIYYNKIKKDIKIEKL